MKEEYKKQAEERAKMLCPYTSDDMSHFEEVEYRRKFVVVGFLDAIEQSGVDQIKEDLKTALEGLGEARIRMHEAETKVEQKDQQLKEMTEILKKVTTTPHLYDPGLINEAKQTLSKFKEL